MSETTCSSATDNGFNIPEYVLERLMDSFSNDLDIDESLFVESDSVCIRRPLTVSMKIVTTRWAFLIIRYHGNQVK